MRIVAAEPDLEAGTLLITGFNFSTGSSFDGVVELFFPPDAQIILAGPLPGGIEDFPGTYVLQVRREDGSGDKDKDKGKGKDKDGSSPGSADDIDVTFGAVGLTGATGPQGEQGKLGPQGPQGKIGPQGVQGKLGPQGDQGGQGKIGPQGPVGSGWPHGTFRPFRTPG